MTCYKHDDARTMPTEAWRARNLLVIVQCIEELGLWADAAQIWLLLNDEDEAADCKALARQEHRIVVLPSLGFEGFQSVELEPRSELHMLACEAHQKKLEQHLKLMDQARAKIISVTALEHSRVTQLFRRIAWCFKRLDQPLDAAVAFRIAQEPKLSGEMYKEAAVDAQTRLETEEELNNETNQRLNYLHYCYEMAGCAVLAVTTLKKMADRFDHSGDLAKAAYWHDRARNFRRASELYELQASAVTGKERIRFLLLASKCSTLEGDLRKSIAIDEEIRALRHVQV